MGKNPPTPYADPTMFPTRTGKSGIIEGGIAFEVARGTSQARTGWGDRMPSSLRISIDTLFWTFALRRSTA